MKDIQVVLNEGSGKVINDLYNQWNNVKTDKQYADWIKKARETKFGTYGTISFEEILDRFNFDDAPINSFHLKTFKKELENALNKDNKYAKGTTIKGGKDIGVLDYVYVKTENNNLGIVLEKTQMGGDLYYVATYYGKPREKRGHYRKSDLTLAKNNETRFYAKGTTIESDDLNDDLLYFDIPTWAVTSLVNSDDSGLEDEDIEKLNEFVDKTVSKYGNANFMIGSDEEMESQFKYKNDIDGVLGADVVTMYLQPTKNYAKGTTIEGGKDNEYRKGGNIPSIEKRVAEVNEMIKKGNELGIEVINESITWQSPMKYKPFKYSNGVLYEEYEELDLYKYNKGKGKVWITFKNKVLKDNIQFDSPLNDVAKMYRKALKHYEKYGYYADGGGIDENDIKQGDYVDFESYGEFYVCNPSYSENYFWVTKEKEDRYDSNAQGYSVPKSSAIEIIETDEEYADGGSLEKKYSFSEYGVVSYKNLIDRGIFKSKFKSKINAVKYDRNKFNRMDGNEQKKYYEKLNKQKFEYNLTFEDGSFYSVPKEVYDYANINETDEQNYYTNYFANGGGIKAIFSKEGIEASNPFAFRKKLEFAKKHPELLMLEMGGGVEEFNYNPKIDYFSEYHLLPKKVQDIVFKEEYEDSTYESNNKLIKELNGIGWTADYDLSGGMYDLKPIGYEEFSLGGKIDNGYFNNCFLKSIFGV
jgi:hypothetical protein